jgi:hypothetical protein
MAIQEKIGAVVWEVSKLQAMLAVTIGTAGEAFRQLDGVSQDNFMEACGDKVQAVIDLLLELGDDLPGEGA